MEENFKKHKMWGETSLNWTFRVAENVMLDPNMTVLSENDLLICMLLSSYLFPYI